MRLPSTINELPVISRRDPRVVMLPDATNVNMLRARGYDSLVRTALVARNIDLPPVDDINVHLAEMDEELKRLSSASVGTRGLRGQVIVPEHQWCLIPLARYETNTDDLAELTPKGYMVGAEVAIVNGVTVCDKDTPYHDTDLLDAPTVTALRAIGRYLDKARHTECPVMGDIYPHQCMRPGDTNGTITLSYVDLDPLLTTPHR
jgi:hypothetical protein